MKKLIAMVLGLGILFGATSQAGASSAVVTTVSTSPSQVTAITKNTNNYQIGIELQPQQLVNGKWKDLDWYDYDFVSPNKSVKDREHVSNFAKGGTYRYVVSVDKFDKDGFQVPQYKYVTRTFKINK